MKGSKPWKLTAADEIEDKPTLAAIIEIDHSEAIAIHKKIGEAQIRMDQAESLRPSAINGNLLAQQRFGSFQHDLSRRIETEAGTPIAPMGCRAEDGLAVPGFADEAVGFPPTTTMHMQPGIYGAETLEPRRKVIRSSRLPAAHVLKCHDIAPLPTFLEGTEHNTILGRNGSRRIYDARTTQCFDPGEVSDKISAGVW